jgi:hypothetical protein
MPDQEDDAAAQRDADEAGTGPSSDNDAAAQAATAGAQAADSDIEETLDATVAAGEAAPERQDPEVKSGYDPGRYQDATRSYIAYWLLTLLTLMVLGGFGMLFALEEVTFEHLKSILDLVFGPIVALVSAATGFYFGAQQFGANKKP